MSLLSFILLASICFHSINGFQPQNLEKMNTHLSGNVNLNATLFNKNINPNSNPASDPMVTFTKQILPATCCHNQPLLVPITHIGSKHVFLSSIVQKFKTLTRSNIKLFINLSVLILVLTTIHKYYHYAFIKLSNTSPRSNRGTNNNCYRRTFKPSATSTFLFFISFLTTTVNSHYYGSCIGSMDRTKTVPCSTDDIYVYVNTNHGGLTGSCFSYASQARVRVTGSGVSTFDRRSTLGTVGASSNWASIPNCLGSTVTGSKTNMICKANGMQPYHCTGGPPNWFRYGPISKNGATALTISVYGMGCDSESPRRTWNFTPKLCQCSTSGEGLSATSCNKCARGQAAADGISPCAPCTGGKYQDQNVASAWGCVRS